MRVVVDASVAIAALTANGNVRDVLLSSADHDLFAPQYVEAELARNAARISRRSHVAPSTVRALIEDVFQVVELVPAPLYDRFRASAPTSTRRANARGDEDYIALAMFLDSPIWTLDEDFRRIPGLSVLTTREVADL
jgi:predicted nucleic acid-binding protein